MEENMSEPTEPDFSNPKHCNPEPRREKDERERFEVWWAVTIGTSMKGSKRLARNAWLAALWEYGVKTRSIKVEENP
jgi:hypothetical protein